MKEKPTIVLVDDHQHFREGIKLFLEIENIGVVIAEAENGLEFLHAMVFLRPDIVIMDVQMPQVDGVEATKIALSKYPEVKILVLSMFRGVNEFETLISAGISGFIVKSSFKDEIEIAIETILSGNKYFSSEIPSDIK
jgi:DNA-binding NarL/FixJ family response regulator